MQQRLHDLDSIHQVFRSQQRLVRNITLSNTIEEGKEFCIIGAQKNKEVRVGHHRPQVPPIASQHRHPRLPEEKIVVLGARKIAYVGVVMSFFLLPIVVSVAGECSEIAATQKLSVVNTVHTIHPQKGAFSLQKLHSVLSSYCSGENPSFDVHFDSTFFPGLSIRNIRNLKSDKTHLNCFSSGKFVLTGIKYSSDVEKIESIITLIYDLYKK